MRKTEGYKSIESYLFCQQQSRQAVSNARSSKHNRYSTCSAPPLPNFHRQSEWQGCRNCEFRHIKKKSDLPSSYHHRQRRRKGSGTHTFVKLCSKHTQNGELHDVTRRCAFLFSYVFFCNSNSARERYQKLTSAENRAGHSMLSDERKRFLKVCHLSAVEKELYCAFTRCSIDHAVHARPLRLMDG